MVKVFFCTPTGKLGASSRYRVFQFIPYLEEIEKKEFFSFLDDKSYELFKSNKIIKTLFRVLILIFKPVSLLIKVKKNDVLFIHRDIYPFGPFWIEKLLKLKGAKIIFDLDDAIFLEDTSEITNKKNKLLYKLKYGKRFNQIIKMADIVIAGNSFLASYCEGLNLNTKIIPTVIDLKKLENIKPKKRDHNKIVFGWIGNPGNSKYFYKILPIFDEMAEKYQVSVNFKCIGGKINYIPKSNYFHIIELHWREESEYDELNEIDVGIMPLEKSEWSKGKCGLKILQYMSVSKPTIADAVGANKEIIDHKVDGFLTNSIKDWEKYIEFFIKERKTDLIENMGKLARNKLEKKYSLQSNLKYLKESFYDILGRDNLN